MLKSKEKLSPKKFLSFPKDLLTQPTLVMDKILYNFHTINARYIELFGNYF